MVSTIYFNFGDRYRYMVSTQTGGHLPTFMFLFIA